MASGQTVDPNHTNVSPLMSEAVIDVLIWQKNFRVLKQLFCHSLRCNSVGVSKQCQYFKFDQGLRWSFSLVVLKIPQVSFCAYKVAADCGLSPRLLDDG